MVVLDAWIFLAKEKKKERKKNAWNEELSERKDKKVWFHDNVPKRVTFPNELQRFCSCA